MRTPVHPSWRGVAIYIVAPVVLLMVAACGTMPVDRDDDWSPTELAGTGWTVSRIDGRAPLGDSILTTDFGVDGRVNGDSGCNSFSGPYIQTGTTVRFGELLSTRRACVDSAKQNQEARMLAILNGATTVRRERGQLTVRAQAGTLVLRPNDRVTAGAASYGAPFPRRATFDCEGTALTVRFESDEAHLTWSEGRDVLRQQPAASGVWYESSRNSLRGSQNLMWTADRRAPRVCRELR